MSIRRAVFDTNVVVSALVFRSRLAWLRQAWKECAPVICTETARELSRVLAYRKYKLDPKSQQSLLEDDLPLAETVALPDPLPPLPAPCRDRNDIVCLQLAMAASCPLVSGDADLTVLRAETAVSLVSATELKSLLYGD